MKRNQYKNDMENYNSESSDLLNEQKMKNSATKIRCVDCGSSNGTLYKVKRNGTKVHVCDRCFQSMQDDD